MQDGEVEMLLDADEVIPRLLDSDKDDGEKAATADNIESVASNGTHNTPSQEGQSIHESVHSHIPNTPPVMPMPMELKVGSNINADDIHQPIVVRALDPGDSLDCTHNDELASLPALLENTLPGSESDTNPDDMKSPIIVPAPDPDEYSNPTPSNNTPPGLETDINPDDIQPPILVPAPDPNDSAEGNLSRDTPAELGSSISPDEIQPPIIVRSPDSDDNANDFHDRLPEIPSNLSASLAPQDAELNVQIQHDMRDPFSPTPHLPPPWRSRQYPIPT